MSNHTTQLPLLTIEYAPWVEKYGLKYPYGQCQCGCGQKTNIARYSAIRDLYKMGEPVRFIKGHHGRTDVRKRFWAKVDKRNSDDCWEWQAGKTSDGYGSLKLSTEATALAHRFSYELAHGPLPDDLQVLHTCDNPPCVNPAHLWLGTHQDNMADMAAKKRTGHNPLRGEQSPNAKLTTADVVTIRTRCEQGETQAALAIEFDISFQHVSDIVHRKTWKHIP